MNNKHHLHSFADHSKLALCICFVLVSALIIGAGKKEVMLDISQNPIYMCVSVDDIVMAYSKEYQSAKEKYDDRLAVLTGKVSQIESNNKAFYITVLNGESNDVSIKCNISDTVKKDDVQNLKRGEIVQVYGRIKFSLMNETAIESMHETLIKSQFRNISITSEKVLTNKTLSIDGVALLDGYSLAEKDLSQRSLYNGKISFSIPSTWETVEKDIKKSGIGTIEGYQYVLNDVPGDEKANVESIFVCFFDSNSLLSDKNEKNQKTRIEKTIICNILGKEPSNLNSFPVKTIKTEVGTGEKFEYYTGEKSDILGSYPMRVEFAFQQVDDRGFIVVLYVYDNSIIKASDGIFVMMDSLSVRN